MRDAVVRIVGVLNERGPLSVAEIAETLERDLNAVRRTVALLARAGWVRPNGFRKRFDRYGMSGVAWESMVKIKSNVECTP